MFRIPQPEGRNEGAPTGEFQGESNPGDAQAFHNIYVSKCHETM